MEKIRILVAQYHNLLREGIRAILSSAPDLEITGEAPDLEETLRLAQQNRPDLILFDLDTAKGRGLEAVETLLKGLPGQRILIVTCCTQEEIAMQALQKGVKGYLSIDSTASELLQAIRTVHRGQGHLQPEIAHKIFQRMGQPEEAKAARELFTRQERSVFELLVRGLSNKEIAEQLSLSDRTIEVHIRALMKKLKVSSRVQLVLWAFKSGWVNTL